MANGEPGASAPLQRITEQIDLFQDEAAQIEDREGWQLLRVRWIGRKQGIVRSLLAQLKDVPPAEKKDFGQIVNQLKELVEERLASLDEELTEQERLQAERSAAVDVTLPGRQPVLGSVHPVNLVTQKIVEIFTGLGYSVADGPEVEDDYHNFEALNFPPDHPARDTQDTFFLQDGRLLRTHTSPVQIRTMLE
ncbi:MAG: phenylalanine--tRNA ligase subunit alpha, partial [Thermoanaerobaculia bacterium]